MAHINSRAGVARDQGRHQTADLHYAGKRLAPQTKQKTAWFDKIHDRNTGKGKSNKTGFHFIESTISAVERYFSKLDCFSG